MKKLKKTNQESIILTMHINSYVARDIFSDNPTYKEKSVTILQLMKLHEKIVLVEFIETEKYFVTSYVFGLNK